MNERQYRAVRALRDDQAAIRTAAGRVRDPGPEGPIAGLGDAGTAELLAGLLDVLADGLDRVPGEVRRHTARVAQEMGGAPMGQPSVRRTRRR